MKVHFVGIGGVSMSALAKILLSGGNRVSGSDLEAVTLDGIDTYVGHSADNIGDAELVVYTAAIKPDNIELTTARKKGIPCISRSELLGRISREFAQCVAVSGAHGKTTTSAMIAHILEPLNPTVHLGGSYKQMGGNLRLGGNQIFVTEACEYVRSFLTLCPTVGVILNIAPDHLDYFRDIEDITDAFMDFSKRIRPYGTLVINGDDIRCRDIIEKSNIPITTFGLYLDNNYAADGITMRNGCPSFYLVENAQRIIEITLNIAGEYNVLNALAAIATARKFGLTHQEIAHSLTTFNGVERRFQDVGLVGGARVIVDYAHHPDELKSVLKTARTLTSKKLIAVFQPHTYSRTKSLLEQFADALQLADHIIVADIFAAREAPIKGVTSRCICDALQSRGKDSLNPRHFGDIITQIKSLATQGDIVLILGAGDINKIVSFLA